MGVMLMGTVPPRARLPAVRATQSLALPEPISRSTRGAGAERQRRAGAGERERADGAVDQVDGALVGGRRAAGHRDAAADGAGAAQSRRRRRR